MIIILNRKKTNYLIITFLLLLILKIIRGLLFFSLASPVLGEGQKLTIVIDPGHGGRDPGANVGNILEKEINLDIAKRIKTYLENRGYKVHLTRTTDTNLVNWKDRGSYQRASLKERLDIAKKQSYPILISIHCNSSGNKNYFGPQTFYKEGDLEGEKLATNIQRELSQLRNTNRQAAVGEYYLLDNAPFPTVIVEIGFLSNEQDREMLCKEDFRQRIAQAIGQGIQDSL